VLRIERHALGPRLYVAGRRVHEWHGGVALLAAVAAVPGVDRAAIGTDVPLGGGSRAIIVAPEGNVADPSGTGVRVYFHSVTPAFFETLGTAMPRGRAFDSRDTAGGDPVVIVNRSFASKVWQDQDPIGRRIRYGRGEQGRWLTVVGVAPDMRYRSLRAGVDGPEDPDIFFPFAQMPDRAVAIVARGQGVPSAIAAAIRDAVERYDRDLPLRDTTAMSTIVAERTSEFRLTAGMMAVFGAVALLLAGIGVYGLINYAVAQRRQEIGVRVALGADRREIYALVLKDGLLLTLAGLAIGLVAALPASRLLSTQLYGVHTFDPLTYAAIAGLLTMTSVAATLVPAWRAARVDPIVALRAD
jgi:predicted permease